MKIVIAIALAGAAPGVIAGELLDQMLAQDVPSLQIQQQAAAQGVEELEPITVLGRSLGGLDMRVRDSIPCMGCDGHRQGLPFALRFSRDLGLMAAGLLFQPVRVRGEPNDEAAYYNLRMTDCPNESAWCADRHPNPGLYNWKPSEQAEDDWTLHRANSILQSK